MAQSVCKYNASESLAYTNQKLGPAGQERSLLQLSLDDDFKYELGSLVLKVGVDARYACQINVLT